MYEMPHDRTHDKSYECRYSGDGTALALIYLKNAVLTVLTLGAYGFWGKVATRSYLWQHTAVGGERLAYHGTGRELAIGFLKALGVYLAASIVMGLVSQFSTAAGVATQFLFACTLIVLVPYAIFAARRYLLSRTSLRGIRFGMRPDAAQYAQVAATGYLLTALTLGFYWPVHSHRCYAFRTNASYYGTAAFRYTGSWRDTYWPHLGGLVLTVLTAGLYHPFLAAKLSRYRAAHTHIGDAATGRSTFRHDVTGTAMLGLGVASFLLLAVTGGLATPWVVSMLTAYRIDRTTVTGGLDLTRVAPAATAGSAVADGVTDAAMGGIGFEV